MTQVEDEYHLNWCDMIDCSDINVDGDLEEREVRPTETTSKDESQTRIKDNTYQQEKSDVRKHSTHKRDEKALHRFQESPVSERISKSESLKYVQRRRDNDLRSKLNQNRRGTYSDGHSQRWRRDSPSERPRYTERPGGISPLRSPINRSKQMTIFDLDNSNNFRFTKHLTAAPQKSVFPSVKAKDYSDDFLSPDRKQKERHSHGSDDSPASSQRFTKRLASAPHKSVFPNSKAKDYSDDFLSPDIKQKERHSHGSDDTPASSQSGTPVISGNPKGSDRQSWSRRKLYLPLEKEGTSNASVEKAQDLKENDTLRLARREKDIAYGKITAAYKMYIEVIPVSKRSRDRKLHPQTPDKYKKCSRRSWDSQVKLWKRRLHEWASGHGLKDDMEAVLHKADSETTDTSTEPTSMKETDDLTDMLDNSMSLSDKELTEEEEDDSFLDSMDMCMLEGGHVEKVDEANLKSVGIE